MGFQQGTFPPSAGVVQCRAKLFEARSFLTSFPGAATAWVSWIPFQVRLSCWLEGEPLRRAKEARLSSRVCRAPVIRAACELYQQRMTGGERQNEIRGIRSAVQALETAELGSADVNG